MNNLEIFNFNDNAVRTVVIENEPWFVLKDVCGILEIKNPTDVAKRLDEDEVARFNLGGLSGESNIVSESGLYSVTLRSDKPQAKPFQRWVTKEVLPTIRKHGAYMTPETIEKTLRDPDYIIGLVTALKEVQEENRTLGMINNELKPKADYLDKILKSKSLMTITQIAKDYGMSGQAMNKLLHKLGIQFKQSDQWLLYQKHQAKGYTHSETIDIETENGGVITKLNTKWTQKGRLFLYDILKNEGVIPVIERN